MQNFKRHDTNEFVYKTDSQTENSWLRGQGRERGGGDGEFGIDMYTLLYLKWITSKDLL